MRQISFRLIIALTTFGVCICAHTQWAMYQEPVPLLLQGSNIVASSLELPSSNNPQRKATWVVTLSSDRGPGGNGMGRVKITSWGKLYVDRLPPPNPSYSLDMPTEQLAEFGRSVLSAKPSAWEAEYKSPYVWCNPCQEYIFKLELRQYKAEGIEQAYTTTWPAYVKGMPRDLSSLFLKMNDLICKCNSEVTHRVAGDPTYEEYTRRVLRLPLN